MKHFTRRQLFKGIAGLGALVAASQAFARAAFKLTSVDESMSAVYGSNAAEESNQVVLNVPEIAENGLVVPVEVKAAPGVQAKSISVFVEDNPNPLVSTFEILDDNPAQVKLRLKMAGSSNVVAAIQTADGKLLKKTKEVKVTLGGCGG